MSQENVEMVEQLFAAVNAREIPDDVASTAVADKTYYGAPGLSKLISDFFEAFAEGARWEIEEILADGDAFVVARVHIAGHSARSGAPLVLRWMNVYWFHAGKMTRGVGYARRREALNAVGLAG